MDIAKCKSYLDSLSDIRDIIKEPDVSAKVTRLRDLTVSIYEKLYESPESEQNGRAFLDNYLPTTIGVLEKYARIYDMQVGGTAFAEMEASVKNLLNAVTEAFRKLYNNLFEDEMLDMSVDISVLKSMLNQEGLIGQMKRYPEVNE